MPANSIKLYYVSLNFLSESVMSIALFAFCRYAGLKFSMQWQSNNFEQKIEKCQPSNGQAISASMSGQALPFLKALPIL